MEKKILVYADHPVTCEKDKEVLDMMEELRETMFEQDMILSMLQSSSTISQDVYNTVKNDYRSAYTKFRDAKDKCTRMIMDRYAAGVGTLQWNYDQLQNEIYVSVNPNVTSN